MRIGLWIKRKLQAAILPTVLLALVGYFYMQTQQGDRGLASAAQRQADLEAARADLKRAESDLALWDRRVQSLRTTHLDRDVLDERARAMLNLSEPSEIIMPYPQGQRLF